MACTRHGRLMLLAPSAIALVLCKVTSACDPILPALYDMLSKADQARADRFLVADARRLFLVAHAALHHQLLHLGFHPPYRFAEGEKGKPYLPDHPDVKFNLSHTNGLIAVALTQHHDIGVDVEQRPNGRDIDSIAERVFTPSEREEMAACTDPVDRFTQLWCAKEAIMKATGQGFHLPPDQIALTNSRPDLIALPEAWGPAESWWLHSERLGNHWLALAARHPFKQIERQEITPEDLIHSTGHGRT